MRKDHQELAKDRNDSVERKVCVMDSSGIIATTVCRVEEQEFTVTLDACKSVNAVRGEAAKRMSLVRVTNSDGWRWKLTRRRLSRFRNVPYETFSLLCSNCTDRHCTWSGFFRIKVNDTSYQTEIRQVIVLDKKNERVSNEHHEMNQKLCLGERKELLLEQ